MSDADFGNASDHELAAQSAAGDESAYAALIERYQAPLHSYVFRSVQDRETARDLTQEVFIKTWFALKRYRPDARFSTWIFRIAANLCRDYAKSRNRRQDLRTSSLQHSSDMENEMDPRDPRATPDREAESGEALRRIQSEIQALPSQLAQPFILVALEGLSHKEASAILRISPKAVEVRVYRARKRLINRLAFS